MKATPIRPDEILRRAHAVGSYYGFTPFATLAAARKGQGARGPYPPEMNLDAFDPAAREVVGFLKQVRDSGLSPSRQQPLFVWHTNIAPGRRIPSVITLQFHAMGADHAIADAVLIRTVRALLTDLTKSEPVVRLNSMGDKETRGRFARELTQFFRKHGAELPADCTTCAKRDVFAAAELLAVAENANEVMPSSTDHLSEASRKHFEELLEYLEATDTPYELASSLLSRGSAWTETCFEIEAGPVRAWGSRYHELVKPFFHAGFPSIGAVIRIATDPSAGGHEALAPQRNATRPRFVFVHIGEEAKRASIRLADSLRHARIPLTQSIGIESLTEQMRLAETVNAPYLLIMGRKEALEHSVILRECATHIESVLSLDGLIDRLRKVA